MSTPASVRSTAHVFCRGLDDTLVLDGLDGHHLARVLRVRAGEVVTVSDGETAWRQYTVREVRGGDVGLDAASPQHVVEFPRPRIAIAFALTKGSKPETTVQHLTELGVDRIVPFFAAHSIVRWDDAKVRSAHDRFQTIAREASMQSRRVALPEITPARAFTTLLTQPDLVIADFVEAGIDSNAALAQHSVSTSPAHRWQHAFSDVADRRVSEEWCAVVGPEGGFRADERDQLRAASPYPLLAIGSHVLRAETAAIAVATALVLQRDARATTK